MSQVTELASAQLTATDTLAIELVEANETPAVVIIRWPDKPSVIHPRRFPDAAAVAARAFAAATTRLAQLKRDSDEPPSHRPGVPLRAVRRMRVITGVVVCWTVAQAVLTAVAAFGGR